MSSSSELTVVRSQSGLHGLLHLHLLLILLLRLLELEAVTSQTLGLVQRLVLQELLLLSVVGDVLADLGGERTNSGFRR